MCLDSEYKLLKQSRDMYQNRTIQREKVQPAPEEEEERTRPDYANQSEHMFGDQHHHRIP